MSGKSRQNMDDVQRQLTLLRQQQDQLLNLRLLQEIDCETFSRKGIELRDRIMRKPFNWLAEGPLVLSSRGDKI